MGNYINSKRRHFQYSIRTLFAIVTVVSFACAWLAYSLSWIHKRHDALDSGFLIRNPNEARTVMAPAALWILGENGVPTLYLMLGSPQTVEEIRQLFPESDVQLADSL